MAADLPLIVLDEVMLPGADTEVGLEPDEVAQLTAAWGDDGGGAPVLVACRAPGHPTPTRLEQRASRDVISGNDHQAIYQASPDGRIENNLIGVQADGETPLGNGWFGIGVASDNTEILDNTIANNSDPNSTFGVRGVVVHSGTGHLISGNRISPSGRLGTCLTSAT